MGSYESGGTYIFEIWDWGSWADWRARYSGNGRILRRSICRRRRRRRKSDAVGGGWDAMSFRKEIFIG
jgi:hypothetical protein